jgi:hypothetical protein
VKEEQLKGRPGYEHLSDPLHILVEAELPANVIDAKLAKAQEILEELLKPVVWICFLIPCFVFSNYLLLLKGLLKRKKKNSIERGMRSKEDVCITEIRV